MRLIDAEHGSLRGLVRAGGLVWQSSPWLTIGSAVVMFLLGFLPVVPMYVLKLLVDAMEAGESFRAILPLVIVVGGAVLLLALFQLLGSYIKEAQSQVLSDYMQNLIHEKSLELDLSFYEGPEFFDKLHRAQEEAPFRPSQVVETVMSIFRSGISAVSIAGVLIYTLPWYTVIILALAAIPAVFVQLAAAGKFFAWRMMRTSTERHVFYLNWLITGRENAKEIRLFGLGRLFKERSRHWRDRLRREQLSLSARRSAGEFLATGFQAVVVAFLLGFFAYRSIGTSGALGNLVLLFQAIQRGQQVLGNLLRGFSQLYETKLFLAHVFDFLELQPLITANSPGLPPVDRETGIAVDRVSFTYPGTDRLVLDDVSLRVRPGEIVAVVGDNGAGKTTLIKLLCRFYDPAGGVIRLDGQDLRTLEEEALRENMTVLFQDYSNYFYSANENIWFGDVKNEIDEERITAAARQAHMHEFLSGLPQGYETVIGRWLEEGAELSGGQWKRLALARTLYRQSPFIVLDEPTEGLDPYMEASFIDDLRSLAQGRALVMVSHKIASASRADRIYVMREGRVIEQGSHAELVELGGYYAGFYRTQLRQIRSDEYA